MRTETASSTVAEAADALHEARRTLTPIAPVRETFRLTGAEDGYAVQERNTARYLRAGRTLSGRKIGLTSKAVQQQLGVDEPDFGMLWADFGFADGDGVPVARFMQPRIEGEIGFVLDRDLDGDDLTLDDVTRAVAYALPALEIVDSAIVDWNIRLVDTIADNASGAGYAVGAEPRKLDALDLRLCGMVLSRNGDIVSTGAGAACLGHPLAATLWLARKMAAAGRPLRTGELVLSGALGPMVPVRPDDRFTLEIQGFAPLTLAFDR